ncbi:MAG TPA: hypothetical protein VFA34_13770 [Actinomycetota bacterium]|nr:hypothetical protein [Actinomycetota bacterium]
MTTALAESQTIRVSAAVPHASGLGGRARIALVGAAIVLLAAVAGALRAQTSPDEVPQLQPVEFTKLSGTAPLKSVSTDVVAPAAEAPRTRPAQVAPQQVAPQQEPAAAPAGGGDTTVVADNGSSSTQTGSGGSSVNNTATVRADAGESDDGDEGP